MKLLFLSILLQLFSRCYFRSLKSETDLDAFSKFNFKESETSLDKNLGGNNLKNNLPTQQQDFDNLYVYNDYNPFYDTNAVEKDTSTLLNKKNSKIKQKNEESNILRYRSIDKTTENFKTFEKIVDSFSEKPEKSDSSNNLNKDTKKSHAKLEGNYLEYEEIFSFYNYFADSDVIEKRREKRRSVDYKGLDDEQITEMKSNEIDNINTHEKEKTLKHDNDANNKEIKNPENEIDRFDYSGTDPWLGLQDYSYWDFNQHELKKRRSVKSQFPEIKDNRNNDSNDFKPFTKDGTNELENYKSWDKDQTKKLKSWEAKENAWKKRNLLDINENHKDNSNAKGRSEQENDVHLPYYDYPDPWAEDYRSRERKELKKRSVKFTFLQLMENWIDDWKNYKSWADQGAKYEASKGGSILAEKPKQEKTRTKRMIMSLNEKKDEEKKPESHKPFAGYHEYYEESPYNDGMMGHNYHYGHYGFKRRKRSIDHNLKNKNLNPYYEYFYYDELQNSPDFKLVEKSVNNNKNARKKRQVKKSDSADDIEKLLKNFKPAKSTTQATTTTKSTTLATTTKSTTQATTTASPITEEFPAFGIPNVFSENAEDKNFLDKSRIDKTTENSTDINASLFVKYLGSKENRNANELQMNQSANNENIPNYNKLIKFLTRNDNEWLDTDDITDEEEFSQEEISNRVADYLKKQNINFLTNQIDDPDTSDVVFLQPKKNRTDIDTIIKNYLDSKENEQDSKTDNEIQLENTNDKKDTTKGEEISDEISDQEILDLNALAKFIGIQNTDEENTKDNANAITKSVENTPDFNSVLSFLGAEKSDKDTESIQDNQGTKLERNKNTNTKDVEKSEQNVPNLNNVMNFLGTENSDQNTKSNQNNQATILEENKNIDTKAAEKSKPNVPDLNDVINFLGTENSDKDTKANQDNQKANSNTDTVAVEKTEQNGPDLNEVINFLGTENSDKDTKAIQDNQKEKSEGNSNTDTVAVEKTEQNVPDLNSVISFLGTDKSDQDTKSIQETKSEGNSNTDTIAVEKSEENVPDLNDVMNFLGTEKSDQDTKSKESANTDTASVEKSEQNVPDLNSVISFLGTDKSDQDTKPNQDNQGTNSEENSNTGMTAVEKSEQNVLDLNNVISFLGTDKSDEGTNSEGNVNNDMTSAEKSEQNVPDLNNVLSFLGTEKSDQGTNSEGNANNDKTSAEKSEQIVPDLNNIMSFLGIEKSDQDTKPNQDMNSEGNANTDDLNNVMIFLGTENANKDMNSNQPNQQTSIVLTSTKSPGKDQGNQPIEFPSTQTSKPNLEFSIDLRRVGEPDQTEATLTLKTSVKTQAPLPSSKSVPTTKKTMTIATTASTTKEATTTTVIPTTEKRAATTTQISGKLSSDKYHSRIIKHIINKVYGIRAKKKK